MPWTGRQDQRCSVRKPSVPMAITRRIATPCFRARPAPLEALQAHWFPLRRDRRAGLLASMGRSYQSSRRSSANGPVIRWSARRPSARASALAWKAWPAGMVERHGDPAACAWPPKPRGVRPARPWRTPKASGSLSPLFPRTQPACGSPIADGAAINDQVPKRLEHGRPGGATPTWPELSARSAYAPASRLLLTARNGSPPPAPLHPAGAQRLGSDLMAGVLQFGRSLQPPDFRHSRLPSARFRPAQLFPLGWGDPIAVSRHHRAKDLTTSPIPRPQTIGRSIRHGSR